MVVALNMADLVKKNGDNIDVARLEKALGCPVVMISALKNSGVDALIDKAKTTAATKALASAMRLIPQSKTCCSTSNRSCPHPSLQIAAATMLSRCSNATRMPHPQSS